MPIGPPEFVGDMGGSDEFSTAAPPATVASLDFEIHADTEVGDLLVWVIVASFGWDSSGAFELFLDGDTIDNSFLGPVDLDLIREEDSGPSKLHYVVMMGTHVIDGTEPLATLSLELTDAGDTQAGGILSYATASFTNYESAQVEAIAYGASFPAVVGPFNGDMVVRAGGTTDGFPSEGTGDIEFPVGSDFTLISQVNNGSALYGPGPSSVPTAAHTMGYKLDGADAMTWDGNDALSMQIAIRGIYETYDSPTLTARGDLLLPGYLTCLCPTSPIPSIIPGKGVRPPAYKADFGTPTSLSPYDWTSSGTVAFGHGSLWTMFDHLIEIPCCPSPPLLRIPYKRWKEHADHPRAQFEHHANWVTVNRWSATASDDPFHTPHPWEPRRDFENYLALEDWASRQCWGEDLHVPHKIRPTPGQEYENWTFIERWVSRQ